jgi:hypothetical protein
VKRGGLPFSILPATPIPDLTMYHLKGLKGKTLHCFSIFTLHELTRATHALGNSPFRARIPSIYTLFRFIILHTQAVCHCVHSRTTTMKKPMTREQLQGAVSIQCPRHLCHTSYFVRRRHQRLLKTLEHNSDVIPSFIAASHITFITTTRNPPFHQNTQWSNCPLWLSLSYGFALPMRYT